MGDLLIRTVIEIAGFPKEHIEEVMKKIVDKLKNEKKVMKAKIFEAKKVEKIFSTFTEAEINFENIDELIGFCLDYYPSSIEVLEPEKFEVAGQEFTAIINDLLAKLHEYDSTVKRLKASYLAMEKKLKNQ